MIAALPASPNTSPFQRFVRGLSDLLRSGYGSSTFVVSPDGDFVHTGTVLTVKMEKGETLETFHIRLRRDYGLQPGDTIDILSNGGKADTAKLTLRPRA